MRSLQILALLVVTVGLAACNSGRYRGSRRDADPNRERYQYVLYAVEIDREAAAAGAPLLFNEPPTGVGSRRRAQGFFAVTDEGFCRVDVRVGDSFVGVNGRRIEHGYNLLSFYGRMDAGRNLATITSGEQPVHTPVGVVTKLTFDWHGKEKVTIRAHSRDRKQVYIYHFHDHRVMDRNVPFPH